MTIELNETMVRHLLPVLDVGLEPHPGGTIL